MSPAHVFDGANHVENRMAGAGAKIVTHAATLQPAQDADMSIGEIADMNIVPNATAVRSRVILAENGHFQALAEDRVDDKGNQMGLRALILAEPFCRIAARGIEIAQARAVQPMGAISPEQGSP